MKKTLLTLIFMSVLGISFAQQAQHWTTITGTQYNMTMSGLVYIDGAAQTSTALEIGAFCGDECRGSAPAQFFPPTGEYVVSLTVVSNQLNGDTITFRLYDHDTQQEFPTESVNSIIFSANENLGSMDDWYPFAFYNYVSISAIVTPEGAGTVTGIGDYLLGSSCTLTAIPIAGYSFVNWTKDGAEVSTNASYTFTVTEAASYTANFMENPSGNHWTTITGTQYNMTMSGLVYIDGVAQTSTALEIGAFCGDECRGSACAQFFPPTGEYVVSLTVVSNQLNGETITFRLFDHTTQQEFPTECVNSVIFSANENLGSMGNWYPFAFVTSHTQTVTLAAGTNWFSSNVEITLAQLEDAFVAGMPNATGTTIKAKDGKTTTYNGTNWRGTLTSLDVAQMYKITASSTCEITLEGEPINPANHPISIKANATTWIGFPLGQSMTVTDAFAGFNAVSGDLIKAKNGNSTSFNGTRWRGMLTNLEPGKGYVFSSSSAQDRTLLFPTGTK